MSNQTDSWVDQYRPETLSDVQGNNSDIDTIKSWADDWAPGDQGILLVGPPGVGKTSTAEAVANRLDLQTIEVNASSARKTDDLKSLARQIRTSGEDGQRLILIDEVDSWHHGADKTVLYDVLDSPGNPVIMTANDEYDTPDGLTRRAETFEFSLGVRSRKAKLREIVEAEGLDMDAGDIDKLAERPDLRSAINDLQIAAEQDRPITGDQREWETSEWEMLDDVLTGRPDLGDISPPDALMWLDECVSAEYRGLEMAMAYEALAMADVQLGRAQDRSYRHWRYARALLEEVAKIRTTEPYFGDEISYNNKSFPEWFRHSKPSPDGSDSTAKLYRALKGGDGFAFAGNYQTFRSTYLPILDALDDEEKYELILSERLEPDEYEALGVTESEFEEWAELGAPEAGEWTGNVQSASEW